LYTWKQEAWHWQYGSQLRSLKGSHPTWKARLLAWGHGREKGLTSRRGGSCLGPGKGVDEKGKRYKLLSGGRRGTSSQKQGPQPVGGDKVGIPLLMTNREKLKREMERGL